MSIGARRPQPVRSKANKSFLLLFFKKDASFLHFNRLISSMPDQTTITTDRVSPVEAGVRRVRSLQSAGQHAAALQITAALLPDFPQNRDLLLLSAISQRHLLQTDTALQTLGQLEQHHPKSSRLHQERGLCHIARKNAPDAIAALLRAVNINNALPQSWRMLEGLYRIAGDHDNAVRAAGHVAALAAMPAEIREAMSLFNDGDVTLAEQITRAFLLRHGNHPEAMRLLAKIGVAGDVLDDAETILEATLALAPDFHAARYDYANVLILRQKYAAAGPEIEQLLKLAPRKPDYLSLAAAAAVGLGEQERAIEIYRQMLEDQPDFPDLHLWLAHALKTIGRLPEAIRSYHAAVALRPDFGDAYWSLANLKTYRFTADEIAQLREANDAPATTAVDRAHLCFALGKALEDRGEFAESWRHYQQGNALKRAESRYSPEMIETNTRHQIATCTSAFFADRKGWGDPRPDPIFVLGLPRAGSTLIEQILASHSQVEGTQELTHIQHIVHDLQGRDIDDNNPRYPGILSTLNSQEIQALGARYLTETQVYRSLGREYFIDKMPNNFRHIGLIHLILPNAKIIDVRRDPLSCCFSNLKQLFAKGQEFTYSIEDIARYYRTYLELMEHWDRVLPGRVLRIQHEDIVEDLESNVRRLLDYCALRFEPSCLEFHKNQRSVRTPSSEQVRRPIFRDGLDQWKSYRPQLEPLKFALGDALTRYRSER